jgi:hypothetical protein
VSDDGVAVAGEDEVDFMAGTRGVTDATALTVHISLPDACELTAAGLFRTGVVFGATG